VAQGKNTVLVVFALQGVVFGSWVPRIPAIADQINAEVGEIGLALLGGSVGMISAALVVGRLAARFGARLLVLVSGVLTSLVMPLLAFAPTTLALGLTLVGVGAVVATMDVSMNIAAVTVVRRTGRPLMPVFHAAFSFGGLAGAAGAAVAAGHRWAPKEHFSVVAALALLILLAVVRWVPNEPPQTPEVHRETPKPGLARRPVLWLLAAIALCSAVAEGASAEWSALFAVRERGFDEATAAIVYAGFSVAMAVTRLVGERAERRFGPIRLLVAGGITAGSGLVVAVAIPAGWPTFLGFGLAGIGLAYAFPTALGLASAAGRRADGSGGERELSFVTAIAYSGFLMGPPMVGGIAHVTNLAVALGVVGLIAALIAPAAIFASAARHREEAGARPPSETVSIGGGNTRPAGN
jgi:predicted MFS family arabinose efflux permease